MSPAVDSPVVPVFLMVSFILSLFPMLFFAVQLAAEMSPEWQTVTVLVVLCYTGGGATGIWLWFKSRSR